MSDINMTQGEAVVIFRDIYSKGYTALQKRLAIRLVAEMNGTMLNKITKADFANALRWQQGLAKREAGK